MTNLQLNSWHITAANSVMQNMIVEVIPTRACKLIVASYAITIIVKAILVYIHTYIRYSLILPIT